MKRSTHLGDLGFETMLEVARPGMRGIEVVAEMERAARRQGADHAKYWMASGPPTTWEETRLDIKPHERVLEEGDLMAVLFVYCVQRLLEPWAAHGDTPPAIAVPETEISDRHRCSGCRHSGDESRIPSRRHRRGGAEKGSRKRLGASGRPRRPRHRARLQREAHPRGEQQVVTSGRQHDNTALSLLAARVRQALRPAGRSDAPHRRRARVPDGVPPDALPCGPVTH